MIYHHIGITAAAGGVSRALTFFIPFLVARIFGIGLETDAFFLAAAVILFWTTSVATVLETATISRAAQRGAEIGPIAVAIGLRFTGIAVAVGAGALLLSAIVPDSLFEPQLRQRSQWLFAELSPLLIVSVWNSVLAGWLNASRRFGTAAISPLFIGIGALASLFLLHDSLGIHAMPLGYVAGELARLGYLVICARRGDASGDGRGDARPGASLAGLNAQWASFVLVALVPIFDRLLAGSLATGSVTALEITERIVLLPGAVMTWAALPVLATYWARIAPRPAVLRRALRTSLTATVLVGAAIAGLLAAAHGPMLTALFDTPQASWPDFGSRAFLWLLPGLPFQMCALALWRAAVVARRPARLLLAASGTVFIVNGVGDLIAIGLWGLPGLTAVTSFAFFLQFVLLLIVCRV